MIGIAAFWGFGYAALLIATLVYGWPRLQSKARNLTGDMLLLIAILLQWIGLLTRASTGHGWPFVSPADRIAGMALLMVSLHLIAKWIAGIRSGQFAVSAIALLLLSFGLGWYPTSPVTSPIASIGTILGATLDLLGGGLLALAAAVSLGTRAEKTQKTPEPREDTQTPDTSANLVRSALLCLAISLAIDTWWLQKVGLGNVNDARQAGTAVAWMVYFAALRLRRHSHWRGWPWTAMLVVGFACILPILAQVAWLEIPLHI